MFYKPIDVIWHLVVPWHRLCFSACYFPLTIFHLIATGQFSTLYSLSALKNAWFAKFWARAGPGTRENAAPKVEPLLSQARGVAIEIGPGSGDWIKTYDKKKVTKIYGVEPNPNHHELLRARITEAGMSDIYTIVPVGIKEWVSKEAKGVDTIVTIQCLCSVPTPKKMIAELYGHLKKGGQWIVYEHVVTPQGGLIARYQAGIDLIWPHFLGGCKITRDTGLWLRGAGPWSKVNLRRPVTEPSYQVLPYIMGI